MIVGAYLAHELGHFLFDLGDVYDKNSVGCLMNRSADVLEDKRWYDLIRKSSCDADIKEIHWMEEIDSIIHHAKDDNFLLAKEIRQFLAEDKERVSYMGTIINRLDFSGHKEIAEKFAGMYAEENLKKLKESNIVGKEFQVLLWICLKYKRWG